MIIRINTIKQFLDNGKSVLILGARGTGKSYYINYLLNDYTEVLKIDLLDNYLYRRYLHLPEQLTKDVEFKINKDYILYIFIDEIQKLPLLLNEVHRCIENFKNRVVFILTGSSARKLKNNNSNLLAGRALFIQFFPLNIFEINAEKNLSKILQYGTLPEAFLENDEYMIKEYLSSYTFIYLKEEILQESVVRNIDVFSRFLEIAAFENGMPVNFSKIAKQVGSSINTVRTHYQILEDTLIAMKIPAWTFSVRKQLQQAAKYYFFDNGIINSLTGELSTELRESSFRYGRLFENYVINEIVRYNAINRCNCKLYHYRTNHGIEIDLIIQRNIKSTPIAVEVKSGKNPVYNDVKQFASFKDDYPDANCIVLCNTPFAYRDNGVSFYPFQKGIKDIFNKNLLL